MKQRVHGVVDLYGNRKPSFEALRQESSPIEQLNLKSDGVSFTVTILTHKTIPAYTLRGYSLRGTVYGYGDLPMEQQQLPLPELRPGQETNLTFQIQEKNPQRIRVDIMRPTGFSACTAYCRP